MSELTPKEKAEDIIESYDNHIPSDISIPYEYYPLPKQCALICVEEIIKTITGWSSNETWKFWNDVKEEIEKL